jgi:hypothetical protein
MFIDIYIICTSGQLYMYQVFLIASKRIFYNLMTSLNCLIVNLQTRSPYDFSQLAIYYYRPVFNYGENFRIVHACEFKTIRFFLLFFKTISFKFQLEYDVPPKNVKVSHLLIHSFNKFDFSDCLFI